MSLNRALRDEDGKIYDIVAGENHPWITMTDEELLKSAGLYGKDMATGQEGYNLAAIMLLGKDDVILNVALAYETHTHLILERKLKRMVSKIPIMIALILIVIPFGILIVWK